MQWSTCPPERWVTLLRTCSDLAGGNNDISWIDDWQKLLVIIKSRPSYNSDRHYVLIKPATWFIRVKLYSKQCQLSIRLVYLTVITYNIQYLQYFCDDIENSCTMNLKLLGLQSISFFFEATYIEYGTELCFLHWFDLFISWVAIIFVCVHLVKTWTIHLFFELIRQFPHIFSEHLAFVPFRFFGCDGSVTETFLCRFREHYKRWIWSISLKHLTKRPSASYWAFCGCTDQLKMLTSFL